MTISNRLNRTTLLGNGVSTLIPIEFPFHSVDDLVVIETVLSTGTQTVKVLTTHYTVTGAQDALGHYPTGGSVVMVSAPAVTVSITVYRDVAALQQVILVENEKIPVKASIESPLDRLTMIAQRLIDRADRTMAQPDGDSANIGNLPAKVVRASRYLGFDGDGNPTMMQTPTGMVTSLAQLTESLKAALPAAGAAGSLRKVTDDARGVWMDTGSQWVPLNGGVINALEYLKGDGTNEATAFQALLDTGKDIFFPPPPVAYGVGSGLTLSTTNQHLFGAGNRSIIRALSAGFNLFTPSVSISGIEIDHLRIDGAATDATTAQYVLFTTSLLLVTKSKFHHLTLSGADGTKGVNNGFLFDTGSNENTVAENDFIRLVGTTAGHGYGAQLGNAHRTIIAFNRFLGAANMGRHAVYVGSGSSYNQVIGNYIKDFNQSGLVVYATAAQDTCIGNRIAENIIEGGVSAATESAAIELAGDVQRNVIEHNFITGFDPHGIIISDSGQGGLTADNLIQYNVIRATAEFGIELIGTKRTVVRGNTVLNCSASSSGTYDGINVRSTGSFGSEQDVDSVVIGNHSIGSGQRTGLAVDSSSPAPSGLAIRGNNFGAGAVGAMTYLGIIVSGDDVAYFSLAQASNIAITAIGYLKSFCAITLTTNAAHQLDNPSEARTGKELVITIRNNSGGAAGTLTFDTAYLTTGSWTQPATSKSRSIGFVYNGTKWQETFRSAADVAI